MTSDQNLTSDPDEPPSSLPNIAVRVCGFDDDIAQMLGQGMLSVVREVGRSIDLSTLDGITIAIDYDAALRELPRGVEGLRAEERTNDGTLSGVAKAVVVKRDSHVKTHLVFSAGPVCCIMLDAPEPDDFRLALAIIAHECAHVEENAQRESRFPGTLLGRTVTGYIPAHIQQFSEAFWCEYAVCRASARFAPSETARLRESLTLRLDPAPTSALESIRAYRVHGHVERVFSEVALAVLEPLRMASYLFGHLDGLAEGHLPDARPELPTKDEAFLSGITILVDQLRSLWDTQTVWKSHDDMLVLGRTAFDVIRAFGVDAQERPEGLAYIDVPFTRDTLPDDTRAIALFELGLLGRTLSS